MPFLRPRPRVPTPVRAREGIVLVVDDNPLVRAVVARLVARLAPGAVTTAEDAPTAVAAAREAGSVALVVTYLELPGADGIDLARALAPGHPGLRVVFMSGRRWSADDARRAAGLPYVFLRKPFNADALGDAIERASALGGDGSAERRAPSGDGRA